MIIFVISKIKTTGDMKITKQINERYSFNKNEKCNTILICPICGKTFIKKQYSQAFCNSSCKNKYHNLLGDRHKKKYNSYSHKPKENKKISDYFQDLINDKKIISNSNYREYFDEDFKKRIFIF